MEWTWLLAPGGGLGLLVTWIFRHRIAQKAAGSWLGRRIKIEGRYIADKELWEAQIEAKAKENKSIRESCEAVIKDYQKQLEIKDQMIGTLTISAEYALTQLQRFLSREQSTLTTSVSSPENLLMSVENLQPGPTLQPEAANRPSQQFLSMNPEVEERND